MSGAGSNPQAFTVHHTVTEDGWILGMKNYAAKDPVVADPVLLVHGLGCNHAAYDLTKSSSLAYHLVEQGYDVWLLDLRGAGLSRQPPPGDEPAKWGFLGYLEQDLPAAIKYVMKLRGTSQVHYVGHSMGGILGLCATLNGTIRSHLKSITTIATTLEYEASSFRQQDWLLSMLCPLDKFDLRSICQVYSYFMVYPDFLVNPFNVEYAVMRELLQTGYEELPLEVPLNLRSSIEEGGLKLDLKKTGELKPVLHRVAEQCQDIPVLMISGSCDHLCPPNAVESTYTVLKSLQKKVVHIGGKQMGCVRDYGHFDLLVGTRAPQEVFPRISSWLAEVKNNDNGG